MWIRIDISKLWNLLKVFVCILFLSTLRLNAQKDTVNLTFDYLIELSRNSSPQSIIARHTFRSNAIHRCFRCGFASHSTLPYPVEQLTSANFRLTFLSPLISNCQLLIVQTAYASVIRLAPLHLRRNFTRPVSCYALFQCVAASKPTSWLSMQLHILLHLTCTLGP